MDSTRWLRRAQPLLGTLVEIGARPAGRATQAALDAAFAAVREVQGILSRFDAGSDVSHFNALACGETLTMRPATREVLEAAHTLRLASGAAFDITLGSAPDGWRCNGDRLQKLDAAAQFDLGGIGKGHAVDRAVEALRAQGCTAGWVNAGGDLRVFGELELPLSLRDEVQGGVRRFGSLRDGAFATSRFGAGSRARLAGHQHDDMSSAHVSVAAPLCLWADALTKLVAISGDTSLPLLARFGASAWLH